MSKGVVVRMDLNYQLLPPLTDDEVAQLRASIARRGVLQPVVVDEGDRTIDGHHRRDIAAELGIECPTRVVSGLDEDDKLELALTLNIGRRHLTTEQKHQLVRDLKQRGWRQNRIAAAVGLTEGSVSLIIKDSTRTDGKTRWVREHETVIDRAELESLRALRASMSDRGNIRALIGASTEDEWFTPAKYLDAARRVLGGIDLDPASCAEANETVGAARFYTAEDDGLAQPWSGRVWLNPPYGRLVGKFVGKLVAEYEAGNVTAAILLVNSNSSDSGWWQPLWDHTLCFTDHRIDFLTSKSRPAPEHGATHGSTFIYLGLGLGLGLGTGTDPEPGPERFAREFAQFGTVVRRWPVA